MWRRPASLAQLPGRCRRTQAGAPRPRRARPAGRDSGRACAQRAPEAGWARGREWGGAGARLRVPFRDGERGLRGLRACCGESVRSPGGFARAVGSAGTPICGRHVCVSVCMCARACGAPLSGGTVPERPQRGTGYPKAVLAHSP